MSLALPVRVKQWVPPLALLALVLGVHWLVTVPSAPMLTRSEKGRGAAAEGKAGTASKGAGREEKAFMSEHRDEGFEARHLPALEHAYEVALGYVRERDGELRPHQAPLSHEAFCRRWRCQLHLCGDRKRIRAVHRVVRKLDLEDDRLWDAYELGKAIKRGPQAGDPVCLRATMRFSRPAPELKGIRISEATKAEALKNKQPKRKKKRKKKKKKKKKATQPKAPASAGQEPAK